MLSLWSFSITYYSVTCLNPHVVGVDMMPHQVTSYFLSPSPTLIQSVTKCVYLNTEIYTLLQTLVTITRHLRVPKFFQFQSPHPVHFSVLILDYKRNAIQCKKTVQHLKLILKLGIIAAAVLNRTYYLSYSHLTTLSACIMHQWYHSNCMHNFFNKRLWKTCMLISKSTLRESFSHMFTWQWRNRRKKKKKSMPEHVV